MKRKYIAITSLMLILILSYLVPAVHAYEGKKTKGHQYAYDCKKTKGHQKDFGGKVFHKAHFLLKNKEELGLSDKQVKEIKDLKLKAKKEEPGRPGVFVG